MCLDQAEGELLEPAGPQSPLISNIKMVFNVRLLEVIGHRTAQSLASACVLVFGCRHDVAIGALRWPATEKRQGTKSREIEHRLNSERYEDLMRAPSWMIGVTLTGFELFVCRYGRSVGCKGPFGWCWSVSTRDPGTSG
jgi:hypothetical protein